MPAWIIFYDDGSSFSSDDGGPGDAPREGVQIIAQADQGCGLRWVHSRDFYCWHNDDWAGCWIGHNAPGVRRYRYWSEKGQESGVVLTGYELPPESWYRIAGLAHADPRLPVKTAGHPLDEPLLEDVNDSSHR